MKTYKFDVSKEDTCNHNWTFEVEENGSEKTIRNLGIEFRQGCQGHPKSLAALVANRPVDSIDTDLLSQTTCGRTTSCGMILGKCISQIQNN